MKNAPHVEDAAMENVIQISFGSSHEIAHPASKNFPEALDEDPLEALLAEGAYDDLDEVEEDTYIHAHQTPFQHNPSYCDEASELAMAAIERLKRLKEDAKRLRYYIDELNID